MSTWEFEPLKTLGFREKSGSCTCSSARDQVQLPSDLRKFIVRNAFIFVCMAAIALPIRADEQLARLLEDLDAGVIVRGNVRVQPLASMLSRHADARLREANRADAKHWSEVQTRADWERFRESRLQALRASLGPWPEVPAEIKTWVTGAHDGDGYRVQNLVFRSRPGLIATANLYGPTKPAKSMPAVLIAHSHARPKENGACQAMAMTWARAGCLVLVPDHLGHGERRQHPFGDEAPFDYHGRYDMGVQLHLTGESLMGWLVWDMMRSLDVLLKQKGVDPKRVLLISDPAGGGDIAAVTAALDTRITAVLVNNFGGPQPETAYPLPRDAEFSFNYAGSGSWESTRNLRLSARDGFLPWMIDAAIAPRRLIYYHEFYWDKDPDPVWKRLQRVYGFYGASDALAGMGGQGFVVGAAPANTHWIGINREITYPLLERWYAIPNPKREYSKPRLLDELRCMTADFVLSPLHELLSERAEERLAKARAALDKLSFSSRRERLRKDWTQLLGDVAPAADPAALGLPQDEEKIGAVRVERVHLRTETGIVVPVLLLIPPVKQDKAPVVVCLAQEGKQTFLKRRAAPIAELLTHGVAVCLPDVRGTGESSPEGGRGRGSPATSLSSSEWMLGQSLLGGRLRDVRSVMRHLRQHSRLDASRVALWGDSFAEANPPERDLKVPHNANNRPPQAEPLGGLLAMLGGLLEEDVKAIYVRGGLSDFRSALDAPLMYIPHDVVVPGILTIGDLPDLAATLTPRLLWLDGLVDGMNRLAPKEVLTQRYQRAINAYQDVRCADSIRIGAPSNESIAGWLVAGLRAR
jgi:cephalosporin-C deacetylase-like acetyl esterase